MSKRPILNKTTGKKQIHHDQKETHELLPLDVATLVQISEAQQQLQSAKMNILTRVAQTQWHYPVGQILEFQPDIENSKVTVIMRGEAKSDKAPDQQIIDATKE